jgi:hypothetical protein
VNYIHGQNLERNYGRFLLRETEKPDFAQVIVAKPNARARRTLQGADVTINNNVADFLDWVWRTQLGDPETGEWDRSRFHNPVQRLTKSGLATNTQSDKASLSIRYIRELRGMLAEGRNFRDWTWAQQAMEMKGTEAATGSWSIPTSLTPTTPIAWPASVPRHGTK